MNLFQDIIQHHIYRGVDRPTAPGYDYLLAGNGLFKRAENRYIRACLPLVERPVAGLPHLRPELVVKSGLISGHLLELVLLDARQKAVQKQEQTYLFRVEDGRLRVTRPRQKTSPHRVHSWTEQGYENVLCEIHSHNTMTAFFSRTDDGDEKGFRFYAVLGRLLDRPEILVRLGLYGDTIPLPARLLFTDLGPIKDKLGQERHDGA